MAEMRLRDGRRVLPNEHRKYEVKELRTRHFEIIRRALLGQTYKDIAQDLGITPKNVSDVLNSELAKEQMELLQLSRNDATSDVQGQIAEVSPTALSILRAVIERTEEMISADPTYIPTPHATKIAMDNLDRAGYGAVKRTEERHSHMHFTLAEVERMKENALNRHRAGLDAAKAVGAVVEVESEEV